MASILVCDGNSERQTAKVASRIVDTLHEQGHIADAVDVKELGDTFPADFARFVGATLDIRPTDRLSE